MADIFDTAAGILETAAPTIASMIGGPLAGQAVQTIEKLFGLNPTGDQNAALTAVAGATPEQLIEMKKIDADLKQKFLDAGIQIEQVDAGDRASARAMAISTRSIMPAILSILILFAAVGVGVMILANISPAARDPLTATSVGTIVGYIFSELKQVTTYWFGSSRGSEQKNELLTNALASSSK